MAQTHLQTCNHGWMNWMTVADAKSPHKSQRHEKDRLPHLSPHHLHAANHHSSWNASILLCSQQHTLATIHREPKNDLLWPSPLPVQKKIPTRLPSQKLIVMYRTDGHSFKAETHSSTSWQEASFQAKMLLQPNHPKM